MQPLVNQIHNLLLQQKATVSIAESCTGGLVSYLLTCRPGSSAYFMRAAVVYSNRSKQDMLGLPDRLIRVKGAVSREVAVALAKNMRRAAATDYAAAVTGIAGPTGSTPGKPVGTVFICATSVSRTICRRYQFRGSRAMIRCQAARQALYLLKAVIAASKTKTLRSS